LIAELWAYWIRQEFPKSHVSLFSTLTAALKHNHEQPADICIFDAGNLRDDWDEFVDEAFYKVIAHKLEPVPSSRF